MVQYDVRGELAHLEMFQRENAAAWSHVALVVGDGSTADDETSYVKVEGSVAGRVLRGQRVEHELEVGGALGGLAVEVGAQAEDLRRGDGNLPLDSS